MSQAYTHSNKEISVHFPIKEKHLTDERKILLYIFFGAFLENGIKRRQPVSSSKMSSDIRNKKA